MDAKLTGYTEMINRVVEEAARKRAELIESFVIQYIKDTGLTVMDIELVERHEGMKIVWYFRKKGSSD